MNGRFLMVLTVLFAVPHFAMSAERTITLEQAYEKALETDQSARIAWLESKKSDLAPQSALTRMGPTLTGNARYDWLSRSGSSGASSAGNTGGSGGRTDSGQASITLSQPLFDATVFPAFERGKLESKAAKLQYQFTLREVLFGVTSAYYAVLQQERVVAVDRESVELSKQNVELAEKRAKAGDVTRTDVLRATAAHEGDRRTLIESTSTLELRRNTLANILNLDTAQAIKVIEPAASGPELMDFDRLLDRAYENREDLRAQKLAVDQDVLRRREVKAGYAPKVSANVSALSASTSTSNNSSNSSWEATIQLQIPIFTGGQREIDLRTSEYQIRQTQLNYDKLKKTVQEDVKAAWVDVRTLTETIKALQAQVAAAEQGYADLQNQYKAGTATSIDVLDALKTLNTARRDLAVQTYAYQVALRKLDQVTGVFQQQRIRKVVP